MNRRQFVKTALGAGAFLWLPKAAGAAFMNIGRRKNFAGKEQRIPPSSWESWNQTDQDKLASTNIYACVFSGGASDDETGAGGGLAGADLVLTQNGAIPAVSGGFRELNGVDQYFNVSQALANFCKEAEYTVVIKAKEFTNYYGLYNRIIDFRNAGDSEALCISSSNSKMDLQVDSTHNGTTDSLDDTSTFYYFAGRSGGEIRGGFCTSGSGASGQPTKWSDFEVGKRIESGNDGQISIDLDNSYIGCQQGNQRFTAIKIAWIVIAKEALIDFAA